MLSRIDGTVLMTISHHQYFFSRQSYTDISKKVTSSRMHPVNCVFDTGDGLYILHENVTKRNWMSSVQVSKSSRLQIARCQEPEVVGTILLHLHKWENGLRVIFRILKNQAVLVLLEISFINKFIRGSFPGGRKVATYNLHPVSILMVQEASNVNPTTTKTTDTTDGSVLDVKLK